MGEESAGTFRDYCQVMRGQHYSHPEGTSMKRIAAPAAVLAVFCLTATPAAAQNREHQQMAAELRMLQEQSQQLSLAIQQTLNQLTEAVKAINARLDASEAAMRKTLADQKLIVDGLSTELRVIRERTQDTNTRLGTISEEIESLRNAYASGAAQSPRVDGADPAAAPGDASQSPTVSSAAALSPARLFDQAYADYTAGKYSLAITGFEQFLKSFAKSDRADDAQYYIGESNLELKKTPEAAAAFTAVIQNYANGDMVPMAYYRLGVTQRTLGQTEAARATWETLVKRFPESNSAVLLAKQRLDGLPAPVAPRQP
jgi:tol-pal system protein YbgF